MLGVPGSNLELHSHWLCCRHRSKKANEGRCHLVLEDGNHGLLCLQSHVTMCHETRVNVLSFV